MDIAVVGADAESVCRAAGSTACFFSSLSQTPERPWKLLALARDALLTSESDCPPAQNILLPGDSNLSFVYASRAAQVMGYGFSPRDTLTLSSVTGAEPLICLQRRIVTIEGFILEPQEIPLPPCFTALSEDQSLLAAGLWLLTAHVQS